VNSSKEIMSCGAVLQGFLRSGESAIYRAPRGSECPEALFRNTTLLHKPVILLHDVIEVLHGLVTARARQVARALETRDRVG